MSHMGDMSLKELTVINLFSKVVKHGYNWCELIENYTDIENNLINKVGIVLSQAQTPARRKKKVFGFLLLML